ncbi:MAG: hypothetical protein CVV27_03015 [Candidatus Melainabacteria bacterium HGW-Melainabacteria-1]|nr:MAG: hypothetical protein CVV27_03015 [Candidatus Melainabacteria bacterium HGW-Melainabacteria-1]
MTELRLPADLEQQLQQQAEVLGLSPAGFVSMLLASWQLQGEGFSQAPVGLEQAMAEHAQLLAKQDLWT